MTPKDSSNKCKKVAIVLIVAVLAFATSIAVLLLVAGSGSQEKSESSATESEGRQPTLPPMLPVTPSPTSNPTMAPTSLRPSTAPTSLRPSLAPTTMTPTDGPTNQPTKPVPQEKNYTKPLILSNSTIPVDEDVMFRLKMYWEQHFFWQEEEIERFWCIECTSCVELNFGDDGEGCSLVGWDCEAGNQLWIQRCEKGYGHIFQVNHVGEYDQIKLQNADLCWERTKKRYITVQPCDSSNVKQLWSPLSAEGGFEIKPADMSRDDEQFCVTQQHHPKSSEIVGLKECELAHKWDTGYWQVYELYDE